MTSPADDTVQLRAATAADAGSVVALCKASLTETYGAFMEPDEMRPWTDGTEVEDYVARMWPRMTVPSATTGWWGWLRWMIRSST